MPTKSAARVGSKETKPPPVNPYKLNDERRSQHTSPHTTTTYLRGSNSLHSKSEQAAVALGIYPNHRGKYSGQKCAAKHGIDTAIAIGQEAKKNTAHGIECRHDANNY
jgi:hypothetical protein